MSEKKIIGIYLYGQFLGKRLGICICSIPDLLFTITLGAVAGDVIYSAANII